MENASKALLIAAAILIAISLISVAVYMLTTTDGAKERMVSTMSQQEIESFNQQFLSFESDKQTASNVKNLIQKIATSNTTYEAKSAYDENYVELVLDKTSYTTDNYDRARNAVKSTKRYNVQCSVNSDTGLVNKVTITQVGN